MTHEMSVDEPGVVTKLSPRPVGDTVARLTGMLAAKGVKLFDTIDQRAAAREVGLDLRETVLMIFGNPVAGTPVPLPRCAPSRPDGGDPYRPAGDIHAARF